jgi:hypothetical protein
MKRACPVLALILTASLYGTGADTRIQVASLAREGSLLVSFTFPGGFNEDTQATLASGLEAGITYEVELRREVPVWFDATVAHATVTTSAHYDNLTRVYQLSRTIDGRGEEPQTTAEEAAVRQWLTVLERLPLFRTALLEPNVEYYVKVRARSKPRIRFFFFWPFDRGAGGRAPFTFIQS